MLTAVAGGRSAGLESGSPLSPEQISKLMIAFYVSHKGQLSHDFDRPFQPCDGTLRFRSYTEETFNGIRLAQN